MADNKLMYCLMIVVFSLPCSPYDTLEEVIGMRGTPGHGSLMEWGIKYREMDLAPDGGIDWEALKVAIVPGAFTLINIQYSMK